MAKKQPRKTHEELVAELTAGLRRVGDFIKLKASQNPGTLWEDPEVPYIQLIGHHFYLEAAVGLKPVDNQAWMARVRAFTDAEREQWMEIYKCKDVADLLQAMDLGTVDVELLGEMTVSDHEEAEPMRVFRVGDGGRFKEGRLFTDGLTPVDKDFFLRVAQGHRETATALEELANK